MNAEIEMARKCLYCLRRRRRPQIAMTAHKISVQTTKLAIWAEIALA